MIDGQENATVGSDLNFRFRMLLKGAVTTILNVNWNKVQFKMMCDTKINKK